MNLNQIVNSWRRPQDCRLAREMRPANRNWWITYLPVQVVKRLVVRLEERSPAELRSGEMD